MKMIMAIIGSEDADDLVYELNQNSFFVTKIISNISGISVKAEIVLSITERPHKSKKILFVFIPILFEEPAATIITEICFAIISPRTILYHI